MKNKGFTLIELLAVILILGIIALIAIPAVVKVVDNSKVEAGKNSVHGYLKAVDTAITTNMLNGNTLEDGLYSKGEISNVEIDGKMDTANVQVVGGKVVYGEFCSNGKKYTYDGDEVVYQENDTDCSQSVKVSGKITSIYTDGSEVFMALTDSGQLYGFGISNSLFGKNESGNDTRLNRPVKLFSNYKFSKIALYSSCGVGLTKDGDIVFWGYDNIYYSTLNEPNPEPIYKAVNPVKADANVKFKDVSIDYYNVYAISEDGDIYFAGYDMDSSTYTYKLTLIKEGNFEKVYANGVIAYFIDDVGDVWATSTYTSSSEQYVSRLFGNSSLRTPTKVLSGKNIKDITYRSDNSSINCVTYLGLSTDGSVYIWAYNYVANDIPSGYFNEAYKLTSSSNLPYENVDALSSASDYHHAFVIGNKAIITDYSSASGSIITEEIKMSEKIVDIKLSADKCLILTESGKLYTMGQLGAASGIGVNEIYTEPHKISTKFDDISIQTDDHAISLVNNNAYFTGDAGSYYNHNLKINSLIRNNVSFVSAPYSYVDYYMLDTDGKFSFYSIQNGSDTHCYVSSSNNSKSFECKGPQDTESWSVRFKEVEYTSNYQFFGLSTDNKLYSWGANANYSISSTKADNYEFTTPQVLLNGETVKSYAYNNFCTYIVTSSGDLYSVGYPQYGVLGDGTYKNKKNYVKIASNVKEVAANYENMFYIDNNGDLYMTGYHLENTFGISTKHLASPTKVPLDFKAKSFLKDDIIAILSDNNEMYFLGKRFDFGEYNQVNKIPFVIKKIVGVNGSHGGGGGINKTFLLTTNNDLYACRGTCEKIMSDVENIYGSGFIFFIKKKNGDMYAMGYRYNNIIEPFDMNLTRPTLIPLS